MMKLIRRSFTREFDVAPEQFRSISLDHLWRKILDLWHANTGERLDPQKIEVVIFGLRRDGDAKLEAPYRLLHAVTIYVIHRARESAKFGHTTSWRDMFLDIKARMQTQIEILYSAHTSKKDDTRFSDYWVETGVVRLTVDGPKLTVLSEPPGVNPLDFAAKVDIFTDGSAFDDKAGWGLVVCKEGRVIADGCGPVLLRSVPHCPEMYLGAEVLTNNTGELSGVAHGCRYALLIEKASTYVGFHSDSMYAINVSTGRWKPRKNQRIAKKTRDLMRRVTMRHGTLRVGMHHVRAHTGIKNNERADTNAKRGVDAPPTSWPKPLPSPAQSHAPHAPLPHACDPPSPRPPPEPPPPSH